ncbi:hypothetical protein [Bradyrhizobium sp.]|uniref:hypothetical protein n=1 Tax=Bradyrhizobium sp. TaxID=376 RepID=UPI002CD15825|nr:hypothetical protein [Bradyrhizobium sp.]HWX57220.1 hypothetical protein [Bradyrhizobium sp.]
MGKSHGGRRNGKAKKTTRRDRRRVAGGRHVIAEDGGAIYVTDKGEKYDCTRYRRVLDIRHESAR